MKMESPVRICFGAVIVVALLNISSSKVNCSALPQENTATTLKDEKTSRYTRYNSTWNNRNKAKIPDVALNELNPKVTTSEENTEKNAKYKDRGRVRFNLQSKSSTEVTKRLSATQPTLVIVTPIPEAKKPAQIIDSMQKYKKTKIKNISSTSSSVSSQKQSGEQYDENEEDSFEKYTSSKFDDKNFFTFPNFDTENKVSSKKLSGSEKGFDFSTPFSFSNYFTKDNYVSKENYNSDHFFDFDSDLTTPKNDFFDKKFEEISKSIVNNLETIKSKSSPKNVTNIHKLNIGFEKMNNSTPSNKSSVFIKNTKEIRYLDNDEAGSANKELSDVQGTSIYYEMTVLSTETYNISDTNDDDCDNDTIQENTTKPTMIKPTIPPLVEISPNGGDDGMTQSSSVQPATIMPTIFNQGPIPVSSQNSLIYVTTEKSKQYSSSYNRNKNYAKRLNFANLKDSPNSVTLQSEQDSLTQGNRQTIRRFHHTTPKVKPIWMAPRKPVNRTAVTRVPLTIYSEHFDIKDQFTTTSTVRPVQSSKPVLTTFASEIDPVLQSDVSATKKVGNSPSISDNTIPSLWKRGSTKFSSSMSTSTEAQTGVSDLEIPPTLTAWALASMRSPPPSAHSVANSTGSTHKSVDENELQRVGDVTDKKETSSTSTITSTASSADFESKNITEIYQNKLHLQPISTTTTTSSEFDSKDKTTESLSERLPAESIISIQSTKESLVTDVVEEEETITTTQTVDETKPTWISVTDHFADATEKKDNKSSVLKTIPPVDATKSTGFESITKLPSGVTTPKDEPSPDEKFEYATGKPITVPTTTDYEITTIRFSYVPTEDLTTITDIDKTTIWHSAYPTRTKPTTEEIHITTYRPKYVTTTEDNEEITTIITESTSPIEVSSQIIQNITEDFSTTQLTNETLRTTVETTTILDDTTEPTTVEVTTPVESTTIVVTVATEINTERGTIATTYIPTIADNTETVELQTESVSEENSESNEVITQDTRATYPAKIETTTKTLTTTTRTTTTTESEVQTTETPTEEVQTTTEVDVSERIIETTVTSAPEETTVDVTTKSINDLEDLTSFAGEITTEASSRVLTDEASSGAAIAIAVSTIGVIALVLLIGLLLVVRRRGRRGVYAQRCTPVSLDAYSLDSVSIGQRKGNQRLRASKRSYGNPAYDDEVTSHPMNYAALANFALDIDSITAEFSEIPSVTVRPEEVPPGCEDKNRYSNVLPLPETRVPLRRLGNDPTTEYINANYVTGPGNIRNFYILCQAPLANTVTDFWRMIWEQNSRLIVMLTEYMENGVEKCYEYVPPSEISDNRRTFGHFQVILKKREQRDKYAISSIQVINLATRTWREVTQLWYFWPAKGVPDDYDSVIDFLFEMRSYMKVSQTAKEYDEEGVEIIYEDEHRSSFNNLSKLRSDDTGSNGVNVYSPAKAEEKLRRDYPTNGTLGKMKVASEVQSVRPCVVVCASGAGRSAALVAAEECARALASGRADVPRAVRRLRNQRPHSLTNRHHYIFLYKLLSEYGNKLMGGGVDTI